MRDHVPREFADQVAARDPGREGEALPVGIGIVHRAGHLEQMRFGALGEDSVVDGSEVLHRVGSSFATRHNSARGRAGRAPGRDGTIRFCLQSSYVPKKSKH